MLWEGWLAEPLISIIADLSRCHEEALRLSVLSRCACSFVFILSLVRPAGVPGSLSPKLEVIRLP